MPRKAKEKIEELNIIENEEKVKKVATKKSTKTEKVNDVKESKTTKRKISKAIDNETVKTTKSKFDSKSKSVTSKTGSKAKSSTSKSKSTEKVAKTTTKSKSTRGSSKSKNNSLTTVIPATTEYYDLPFRYNQTVVKILAQTPNTLFIYWDISDEDRNSYVQKYGKDFFNHTIPYLFITNTTMNYTFEVEINDFANSWYLHVNDANCEYKVELKRKFIVNSSNLNSSNIENNSSQEFSHNFEPYYANDYLYITSSNELKMPNDKILFDKLGNTVFFRNTKTNILERKDISSISFLQKIGKVYNIYDLYKEIYQDELVSDEFGLNLPSSSSSSFK